MRSIESTRFIFDTSGLLGVLERQYGDSTRTLPGRKMSQLAQLGMVIVPSIASSEAEVHGTRTKRWLDRNAGYTQVPENLDHLAYAPRVKVQAGILPGFTSSPADVEGACIALALTENRLNTQSGVSNYVVVHDVAYEAACILLGVATVRPEAFVEAFGALPLHD